VEPGGGFDRSHCNDRITYGRGTRLLISGGESGLDLQVSTIQAVKIQRQAMERLPIGGGSRHIALIRGKGEARGTGGRGQG